MKMICGALRRAPRVAFTAVVVFGAALAGGAYVSAHGGDPTAIHACVAPDGTVRVTGDPTGFGDASALCNDKTGEHALDWAQQGPPGERGPQGTVSPTRIVSADLTGSGLMTTVFDGGDAAQYANLDGTAMCPAGQFATGGGYDLNRYASLYDVPVSTSVIVGGTPRGWTIHARYKPPFTLEPAGIEQLLSGIATALGDAAAASQQDADALAQGFGAFRPGSPGGIKPTRTENSRITRMLRGVNSSERTLRHDLRASQAARDQLLRSLATVAAGDNPQVEVLCSG